MLCYNGRVKDDIPGLSFDYELLPAQRIFAGCRTVRLINECSSRPAESQCYPTCANQTQKLSHNVARCRMMSHDAQVNTCYNVNCQRRTREHTLPGATRTQKVVAQCRTMSRDAQGDMCYNVNCQRRASAHDAALHWRKPSTSSTSG